jgi:pimeloyl-[acyl-carrier protein] methyl ester esterase
MSLAIGKMDKIWFLQHGWGFDSICWNQWRDLIPGNDIMLTGDRGYFGDSMKIDKKIITNHKRLVVVTHSFGFHLVPQEIINNAHSLIIISGFDYFHPEDQRLEQRSQKIVKSMLARIESGRTRDLLKEFYKNCYYPSIPDLKVPKKCNDSVLKNDLGLLNKNRMVIENLKNPQKILILHGDKDRIVDISKGRKLHGMLAGSEIKIKEKSGHSLPFSHPEWCIDQILIKINMI